jgi:outer membrane protein assembly factor BamB
MHDVMHWKNAAVLALALLAVGCGSNSKKELPPAELEKFEAEVRLKIEWSRSIGDGQGKDYNMLTPAVDGDRLFAADVEGLVMALDRLTGKVIWKQKLKAPVSGAVGAGYGMVLLGSLNGDVFALDADTGEQKWRAKVNSEVLSAPAINGDVVVVQTQNDTVYAFEAYSGSQRWMFNNTPAVLTLRGAGSPVLTNSLAVVGLSTGKVLALDTQRGLPVWEQRVAVPQGRSELERIVDIDGGLLLSGDTLYAVSYQGRLAALELNSGRVLWEREASSAVGVSQGYGSIYVSQASGTVDAVDERSTSVLWSNESMQRRQLSAPAAFSSYVLVGDLEGYLHLLSQVDGRFVGRERVDSAGLRARPLVVDGWIYAFGNSGKLVALTLR